jgi:hypothetical protein
VRCPLIDTIAESLEAHVGRRLRIPFSHQDAVHVTRFGEPRQPSHPPLSQDYESSLMHDRGLCGRLLQGKILGSMPRVYSRPLPQAGDHDLAPPERQRGAPTAVLRQRAHRKGAPTRAAMGYAPTESFPSQATKDSRAPMPIACMREFLTRPA